MKTTLPWYSSLQLLPSYIYDPWFKLSQAKIDFLSLDKNAEEDGKKSTAQFEALEKGDELPE